MPVVEAENNMPIASNAVYVIPPDATLTLKQRSLQVSRPAPPLSISASACLPSVSTVLVSFFCSAACT